LPEGLIQIRPDESAHSYRTQNNQQHDGGFALTPPTLTVFILKCTTK